MRALTRWMTASSIESSIRWRRAGLVPVRGRTSHAEQTARVLSSESWSSRCLTGFPGRRRSGAGDDKLAPSRAAAEAPQLRELNYNVEKGTPRPNPPSPGWRQESFRRAALSPSNQLPWEHVAPAQRILAKGCPQVNRQSGRSILGEIRPASYRSLAV
jgi:hypothetical protein